MSLDVFQRPYLGRPTVLALDVKPRPLRRTKDGRQIGTAIRPSAGIRANYDAKLGRLIDEMDKSVIYWIGATYRGQKDRIEKLAADARPSFELSEVVRRLRRRWLGRFDDASQDLARYFARAIWQRSDIELKRILRRAGISVEFKISREVKDALGAIVQENVALIRSIPERYLTDVEGSVMRSVLAGRDLAAVTSDLREQHGVTKRRAELISRDQNSKSTSAIQRLQYLGLGIDKAIWRHSTAGKEPRRSHVANDGNEFDVRTGWYDPDEKKYIQPGFLINCRCFSQPILPR